MNALLKLHIGLNYSLEIRKPEGEREKKNRGLLCEEKSKKECIVDALISSVIRVQNQTRDISSPFNRKKKGKQNEEMGIK